MIRVDFLINFNVCDFSSALGISQMTDYIPVIVKMYVMARRAKESECLHPKVDYLTEAFEK